MESTEPEVVGVFVEMARGELQAVPRMFVVERIGRTMMLRAINGADMKVAVSTCTHGEFLELLASLQPPNRLAS